MTRRLGLRWALWGLFLATGFAGGASAQPDDECVPWILTGGWVCADAEVDDEGARVRGTAEICVPGTQMRHDCYLNCPDPPRIQLPSAWTPDALVRWTRDTADRAATELKPYQAGCSYKSGPPRTPDEVCLVEIDAGPCFRVDEPDAPHDGCRSEAEGDLAAQCADWDIRLRADRLLLAADAGSAGTAGAARTLDEVEGGSAPCVARAAADAQAQRDGVGRHAGGAWTPCAPPAADPPSAPDAPEVPAAPSPDVPAPPSPPAAPAPTPPDVEADSRVALDAALREDGRPEASLESNSSAAVGGVGEIRLGASTARAVPLAAAAPAPGPGFGGGPAGGAHAVPGFAAREPAPADGGRLAGQARPTLPDHALVAHASAEEPRPGDINPAAWALLAGGLLLAAVVAALLPLYHRLPARRVLANENRRRVLAAVEASPGATVADVARGAGLRWQHAEYHLQVLARHGSVRSARVSGRRMFWAPGTSAQTSDALVAASRSTFARVLSHVRENPGATPAALRAATGLRRSHVWYYLRRFESEGLVRIERGGARARTFANSLR